MVSTMELNLCNSFHNLQNIANANEIQSEQLNESQQVGVRCYNFTLTMRKLIENPYADKLQFESHKFRILSAS